MFGFSPILLLPLASRIGDLVMQGLDHYTALRASGQPVTADVLAVFIESKMQDWDPKIAGRTVLDLETRHAGARFIAGVVFNLASGG